MARLRLIIPITLLLIGFLVFSATRTVVDTLIVILSIPVACTGGVIALLITHESFSVSAAMGFMTTLVATLGLLPAAVSNGIGAQTQQPLAIVVIGGSLILAVLTRIIQPPMLVLCHRYDRRWRTEA
jgi:cobalt-zinc-cadmium resistance protein CzcA